MAFDPLEKERRERTALPVAAQPGSDGSSCGWVGVLVDLPDGGVEGLKLGSSLVGCGASGSKLVLGSF
jgi:hypothetical protein